MSLSSNSRKERTDSHAAQQAENTMGVDPNLDVLHSNMPTSESPLHAYRSDDIDESDVVPVENELPSGNDVNNQRGQVDSDVNSVEVSDATTARDDDPDLYSGQLMDDDASRRGLNSDSFDSRGSQYEREDRELGHS